MPSRGRSEQLCQPPHTRTGDQAGRRFADAQDGAAVRVAQCQHELSFAFQLGEEGRRHRQAVLLVLLGVGLWQRWTGNVVRDDIEQRAWRCTVRAFTQRWKQEEQSGSWSHHH